MKFDELENSTKVILKVILAVLVLAFLWVVRDIVLLVLLSLILASAMDPMVDYFHQRKIPRFVSVLSVYILVLGFGGLILYLFIPPFLDQLRMLQQNLPAYSQAFQARLGGFLGSFDLSDFLQNAVNSVSAGNVVTRTFGVFNGVLSFISVLVISFYLVAEEKGMKKFVASLIPTHHHEFSMRLVDKIQRKMGMWVLGQVILSFSIFSLSFIGLSIVGMRFNLALFLALLAGMFEIVPYIGPFLSAIPAIFFAFIQSPPLALVVALMYLIIQKTEGYVLVPKVMEKTVGTSPLVVLLSILVGFKLAGIIGLLIAVPLVGALTVVINEFWTNRPADVHLP